jgi:hypothetical protein
MDIIFENILVEEENIFVCKARRGGSEKGQPFISRD